MKQRKIPHRKRNDDENSLDLNLQGDLMVYGIVKPDKLDKLIIVPDISEGTRTKEQHSFVAKTIFQWLKSRLASGTFIQLRYLFINSDSVQHETTKD